MAYNLCLNTSFDHNWKTINCTIDNGVLTSNKKVFGIEQELILPNPTKLYYRFTYKALSDIKEVKLGIQNKNALGINKQYPKVGKENKISLIDIATQSKIKLHLIFESDKDVNRVVIKEPLLVDLNYINKSTWTKFLLDNTLSFRYGYNYINLYEKSEISCDTIDFRDMNLREAKVGSIISVKENEEVSLSAKFIKGNLYLVKLDFEEINKYGDIKFTYGFFKSVREVDNQIYLLFKADDKNQLKLVFENKEVFPYEVNLKHLMIIDVNKLALMKEDIPYLPFI